MKYKVETITPDRARRLIDETQALGFTNRSLRQNRIEKLAHAISMGQWKLTHQPLAISADGAVIDGQHRLHAIIQADQEVEILVVRDADPETFTVVDTGGARTTGDSLKISGYTDVNHLSATIRGYLAYTEVMGTVGAFKKAHALITTADVMDFLDDPHQKQVAQATSGESARIASGLARYGLKTTLGMSMLLLALNKNEVGNSTAAEFYARMEDGVSLAADSPILALRRWFMRDTGYAKIPGENRRPVGCANIIKAMNDYALGRPRSVITFRIGIEPFPAPLPVGTRLKLETELEAQERKAEDAQESR